MKGAITCTGDGVSQGRGDLFALAEGGGRGLVRDGDELLDLVVAGLGRVERRMRAEGLTQFLWDGSDVGVRPKDERALSDFVQAFLKTELVGRGVVLNREAEIRRGETVDLQVDAIVRGREEYERVSVAVEVKGCWHREVFGAIQTQLVDRYLRDSACRHGVYLVGWFESARWSEWDWRRGAARGTSLEELRRVLSARARVVSGAGLTVAAVVMDAGMGRGEKYEL